MTSFFTIELDAFPWNGEGKMPLGMVTGIICKQRVYHGLAIDDSVVYMLLLEC